MGWVWRLTPIISALCEAEAGHLSPGVCVLMFVRVGLSEATRMGTRRLECHGDFDSSVLGDTREHGRGPGKGQVHDLK